MGSMLKWVHDLPARTAHDVTCVLNKGGIVATPTDTFYGLAASPWQEDAIRRIKTLKGQPEERPILVLIADHRQLETLTTGLSSVARSLIERFWPGPLTLVMEAAPALPRLLTGGSGTIGIRQPAHTLLMNLLREVGPVTGTSANRTGAAPATTAQQVKEYFGSDIDLILDGGPSRSDTPSTVISTIGPVRMIREGAIKKNDIKVFLAHIGEAFAVDDGPHASMPHKIMG